MSQFQCGRTPSQAGYPSSSWWALTPPTNYWTAGSSPDDAIAPFTSRLYPQGLMRYYPVFPRAIPHPEVDHLRVTHPFATLGQVLLPALPSDLHA